MVADPNFSKNYRNMVADPNFSKNYRNMVADPNFPDDKQSFTLERVPELLGISRARARQRQERALQIMTSTPERERLVSVFGTKLPEEPDMNEISELVNKYKKKTDERN